jgi:hypothetical protein
MHALKTNFVLCEIFTEDDKLSEELERYYRLPRVRTVRCVCQAGRARAVGARDEIVAWLCERAPLWVVVHVCALLRWRR